MGSKKDLEERFWTKVRSGPNCWEWCAGTNDKGYGTITIDGRRRSAHRVSWELHFGAIPPGLCVCHKCDNPPCIRPDHLFLGTLKDNAQDMANKGRVWTARGELHVRSKLKDEHVREIRRLADLGVTNIKMAEMFGVDNSTIGDVVNRKRWLHVK